MSGYGGNQTARRKTNAFDKQLDTFGALPEVRLVLSILTRAGLDALNGDWRAVAFIQSPDFENYCEWIGVNAERLRERLQERFNERFFAN